MITSRFNIIVKDFPVQGQNILYNARTQALIKIDHAFRDALAQLPGSLEAAEPDERLKRNLQALIENGIVAQDAQSEQSRMDDFFSQLKQGSDIALEATILTTYACNFRCVYCFEESVKQPASMDEATALSVSSWLERRVREQGAKKLYVVYYGGEPLLNTAPVFSISGRLQRWCAENGVRFEFGMITNASLVTRELVEKLLPLGLTEIRTSIDGSRACHDAKRPMLDGSPSFDLIIRNIKAVIDIVPVAIAGNFDRANYPSIPGFLDFLEAEGLLRKLKYVNFLPIAPRLGPRSNPGAIELGECVSFFSKDGMHREILEIKKEIAARGLRSPSGLAINACNLLMRNAGLTVDPLGDIYKCNALLGYPEFAVGNVARGEIDTEKERRFMDADAWKKCAPDCPYVPLCQGGCRFFSYVENKDFTSLLCKRDYFDLIIPELIKLEYANVSR